MQPSILYHISGDWMVLKENRYGVRIFAGYRWDERTPKFGLELFDVTAEQVVQALVAAQTPKNRCYIQRTFNYPVGYTPPMFVFNPLMEVNADYGYVRLFPGVEILLFRMTRIIVDQAR